MKTTKQGKDTGIMIGKRRLVIHSLAASDQRVKRIFEMLANSSLNRRKVS